MENNNTTENPTENVEQVENKPVENVETEENTNQSTEEQNEENNEELDENNEPKSTKEVVKENLKKGVEVTGQYISNLFIELLKLVLLK